jgi:hypothetical protein
MEKKDIITLKAVDTSRSISDLVNNALTEEAEDISAFEERASEPLISYEETVERLKKDGKI